MHPAPTAWRSFRSCSPTHSRLPVPGVRSQEPTVAVLGRLDPIKRPWVAVEVARRLPEAEFLVLGRNHFEGPGSWHPGELPANVDLLGHLDGAEKQRLVRSFGPAGHVHSRGPADLVPGGAGGWRADRGPARSERVVSRFGVHIGEFGGDGLEAVGPLSDGLGCLLADEPLRTRLGAAGREWVSSTHGPERFASTLAGQLRRLDVLDG